MAYDETLAEKVRVRVRRWYGIDEKKFVVKLPKK
jgi:hypothetical protein